MRGKRRLGLSTCVAVFLLAAVHPIAGVPEAAGELAGNPAPGSVRGAPSAGLPQAGDFLGFEIEEERHYRLGPAETLGPNELATWSIRLDRVRGRGDNRRATFTLQHRREAPRTLQNAPTSGEVTIAIVDATLVVNQHGAPLEISYTAQRHIYDIGDEVFQVEYEHDGGHYKKTVTLQGADWDLDIDLIEHVNLDSRVPIGLFAFAPRALECMEWLTGTLIERRTGTGDTGPGGVVESADRQGTAAVENAALGDGSCYERNTDPAFANPGLLSLGMPLLWEQRGDGELVLFSPLRPDLVRSQDLGVPLTFSPVIPTVPGMPGQSILTGVIPAFDFGMLLGGGGADGDKERASDPSRYFFPHTMKLSERQRIDVGARKMEAMPLTFSGFAGTAWVDDWGKVVRLDLPVDRYGDAQRWVRLLHASEY